MHMIRKVALQVAFTTFKQTPRLNHNFEVEGNVLGELCAKQLKEFFKQKRKKEIILLNSRHYLYQIKHSNKNPHCLQVIKLSVSRGTKKQHLVTDVFLIN